jgi:Haem-degrading
VQGCTRPRAANARPIPRTFGQSSAAVAKRMLDDPTSVGSRQYTRVLALSGGLPIKVGDQVVGVVVRDQRGQCPGENRT